MSTQYASLKSCIRAYVATGAGRSSKGGIVRVGDYMQAFWEYARRRVPKVYIRTLEKRRHAERHLRTSKWWDGIKGVHTGHFDTSNKHLFTLKFDPMPAGGTAVISSDAEESSSSSSEPEERAVLARVHAPPPQRAAPVDAPLRARAATRLTLRTPLGQTLLAISTSVVQWVPLVDDEATSTVEVAYSPTAGAFVVRVTRGSVRVNQSELASNGTLLLPHDMLTVGNGATPLHVRAEILYE